MLRSLSPVTDDEPTEDDVDDDHADWRFLPRRVIGLRRGTGRDTWGNSGP